MFTEDGALVLKMEPSHHHDHTHFVEHHLTENFGKQIPREPLHAKHHANEQVSDSIEIPPVHDAFVDSHLYSKHPHSEAHLVSHHEVEYDDDSDGHHSHHYEHADEWEIEHPSHVSHPHHPHGHKHHSHHHHEE